MPRQTKTGEFSLYHVSSLRRRPISLIAQAVGVLAKHGGSLWVSDPTYTFTGSDGTGAAVDNSDTGYVRDLCATYGPELVPSGWLGASDSFTTPELAAVKTVGAVAGTIGLELSGIAFTAFSDPIKNLLGDNVPTAGGEVLELSAAGSESVSPAGASTKLLLVEMDAGLGYLRGALVPLGGKAVVVLGSDCRFIRLAVYVGNWAVGSTVSANITLQKPSLRQIIGRPLFQSTTGFKPKLRLIGGRWAWQFDGIDDYLGTTSKTGESGYLAVAFAESGARWQALLGSGGQTTGDAGISLGLTGGNELSLLSGNASVANSRYIASSAKPAGACVASATWGSAPADVSILYDGAELAFRATAYSQQSESAAGLVMGRISTTTTDFFGGEIFAAAYCPTILSAAEKLIVERAMAQVGGITI